MLVTACGGICVRRKKISVSAVLAGQRLGSKEVDDGIGSSAACTMIWDISTWSREPCRPSTTLIQYEVVTHVSGTSCYLCLRAGH
jgi:hypothetical protein